MDSNSKYELYLIKKELQSIINELDSISYGLNRNFANIGNEKAAACVSNVSNNYRIVKRKLNNIDTSMVKDGFSVGSNGSGGGGGGGHAF